MHPLLPSSSDEPLTLPTAEPPPRRRPLPVLASAVPVAGGLVLWLVTGTAMMLWLAALGPLLAGAAALDGWRSGRRDRRRAAREVGERCREVAAEVARRHDAERAVLLTRHPDVAAYAERPDAVWRGGAAPGERGGRSVVVGRGEVPSAVRVRGGSGIDEASDLRRSAQTLRGAPIVLPADAGIAVVGPPAVAIAVVRALVLQLCLRFPPGELTIEGDEAWMAGLPHARPGGALRIAVGAARTVAGDDAARVVAVTAPESVPPACAAVLRLGDGLAGVLRHEGEVREIAVEAVGEEQARGLVAVLADRDARTRSAERARPVLLADLDPAPAGGGLAAVLGLAGREPVVVDLVADGPHAVVSGVTGAGKSELLVTWATALCATRTPDRLAILLVDFKGGTAFEPLAGLPHVVGVVTDLDGPGARRAIDGLRAEMRSREAELVRQGARDVADAELPRLVVVVDEFAALLGAHPELASVFLDVAARGRALGVHLVLGTQRANGVVRDGLLANCPLRIALRAADEAESRLLLGTGDAARLPGGAGGRGAACLRRAGDGVPQRFQVARTTRDDVARLVTAGAPPATRTWHPPLPSRVALEDLPRPVARPAGAIVVGLADEPERQRQDPALLPPAWRRLVVLGGPRSGRTTALRTIAAQLPSAILLPAEPEAAWDRVTALAESASAGATVLVDDLDALVARFPADYAHVFLERWERILRDSAVTGVRVVASLQRPVGPAARLLDLFEHRLLLRWASRIDHVAAGGEARDHDAHAPAGRGVLDGVRVQVADSGPPPAVPADDAPPGWRPGRGPVGIVVRSRLARRGYLTAAAARGGAVVDLDDDLAAVDVSVDVVAAGDPAPRTYVGDPDSWQRAWRILASVRREGEIVVDAGCAAELRILTGRRELPPYCRQMTGRGWVLRDGLMMRVGAPVVPPLGSLTVARPGAAPRTAASPLRPSTAAPVTRRARRAASERRADDVRGGTGSQ